MDDVDLTLKRLLQSAAEVPNDAVASAPFGFDTRVVALWRANAPDGNGLARLLRRVSVVATAIIVVSSAAAVWEVSRAREIDEPMTNEFAIADSAIQDEISQP
ncbi:MAG: hypothetical protein ABJB69_08135 [Spartobacteria bacterium]